MLLGIVATNESAIAHLVGLVSASRARGWQCRCFLTDLGVLLLRSTDLLELAASGALDMSACEHSWDIYGDGQPPDGVKMASQYQNAELAHLCDKVITL